VRFEKAKSMFIDAGFWHRVRVIERITEGKNPFKGGSNSANLRRLSLCALVLGFGIVSGGG
jgi:hypothetical protein